MKCCDSDLINHVVHFDEQRDLALIELDHPHDTSGFIDPYNRPISFLRVFKDTCTIFSATFVAPKSAKARWIDFSIRTNVFFVQKAKRFNDINIQCRILNGVYKT